MPEPLAAVHAFLLYFVDNRDRSAETVARIEPLVGELAVSDERLDPLVGAIASYEGWAYGRSEPGLVSQEDLAFECRQVLYDLDDHRCCPHGKS